MEKRRETNLWNDDVGKRFGKDVQILGVIEMEDIFVVQKIIFDRIVDVRHFGNVEFIFSNVVKIFFQFQP